MSNGTGTTPQAASAEQWSVADRLGGVFISPVEAFRAIARDPDILPPLIALIAISVIAWEVILHTIGIEQIIRSQLEASGRASAMTAQQMQQAISGGAKFAPIVGRVIALVSVPFFIVILALVGMAIVKGIFGLQISFKTAYSVSTYAWLPWLISGVLVIVVVLFGDPSAFNLASPAPTSLAFFLSQQSVARPLYAAATSIDIFSFWTMGLLGVGFSEATGRKTRPLTIFLCFFGLWVIWVLIRMGLAAL
jgi:hypothetical protein